MKWFIAAMLLGAVIAGWWLHVEHGTVDNEQDPGSVLERGDKGLSVARAYLDEVAGRKTFLLTQPLWVANVDQHGVLLRIIPSLTKESFFSLYEKDDKGSIKDQRNSVYSEFERNWIEQGGRLVVASTEISKEGRLDTLPRFVLPLLPTVKKIQTRTALDFSKGTLVSAVPVATSGSDIVIAREVIGRGDVWYIADPLIFTNAHVVEADHLPLLLALVGQDRPIWFDEVVHGLHSETDVIKILRQWGLGIFLLIAALITSAWFWRRCVIVGKPVEPGRDHRIEAIEGVDALAGLYLHSMTRHDLGELYQQRLVREIALRTGQNPKSARARADKMTNQLKLPRTHKLSEHEFQNALHILNQAFRSIRDEHRRRRT